MVLDYKCQKCCYSCIYMEGSWKTKLHLMAALHFGWLLKQTGQICSLETAAEIDINLFTLMKVPDCKQHLNQVGAVNPVWPGTGTGWVSSLLVGLCLLVIKLINMEVSRFREVLYAGVIWLLPSVVGVFINFNEELLEILVHPLKLPKLKLSPSPRRKLAMDHHRRLSRERGGCYSAGFTELPR